MEYAFSYVDEAIVWKFETVHFLVHSGKRPTLDEIAKTIFGRIGKIRDALSEMC